MHSTRRMTALVFLLVPALVIGCSNQAKPNLQALKPVDRPAVQLHGASSTFAAPVLLRWLNQLAVHQSIDAELDAIGSGASIRSFLAGSVDFAVTDSAPTNAEIHDAPQGMVAFPVTAGAIAIAYNLPGCDLRLSGEQLAEIYQGRITNFTTLGCANQAITVLHRSDDSGSTANLTASLSAFSQRWRQAIGSGRQVRWPVAGQPVIGSDGMASALQQTRGSIGYVEAAYVRPPLQAAALLNRAGQLVRPHASASALALSTIALDDRLLGSHANPPVGYPLVNFSWMLVPAHGLGPRLQPMIATLQHVLSQAGQDDAERLGYVPLPAELRQRALRQLNQLRASPR